jgi:DNA-binding NtrC family response regulator
MLFGDSDAMRTIHTTIHTTIHQLRNNDTASVLITGETGVGKEVVARAIHAGGPRASTPFVPLNCGAIPFELAESIFFGHIRGAFTGAITDQTGYFERADGGTLFLDEVGGMPIETQVKLLRALDVSVITPIGAKESKKVDVRVIAATNADLKAQVETGQFRLDLYFRLAGMPIEISPLRERKADILPLAEYHLSALAVQTGVPTPELTPKAVAALEGYAFPGNVRELRNIIEHALIVSEGAAIQPEHLRFLFSHRDVSALPGTENGVANSLPNPVEGMFAEQERIRHALVANQGNIAKTARQLGLNRRSLYRRLEKYGFR